MLNSIRGAKVIDMGNNERQSVGIYEQSGGYLALTRLESRTLKTLKGAHAWMRRRGYEVVGFVPMAKETP